MQNLCRILIIDDESILRHGLKHLCNWEAEQFCIVGEASNGEQALQMIETVKPHIILTDIVMPIMDGVEFSKLVHSLYPDIKIIVLSSFSEFSYVKEVFKHGASDYLLKATLTSSDLLETLKKVRTETTWNHNESSQIESVIDINNLVTMLINGETLKQTSDLDLIKEHLTHRYFTMVACSLNFLDYHQDFSKSSFEKNVYKLTKHYFSSHIYTNIFIDNKYILLINFDDEDSIKGEIDKFTHHLKNTFSPVIFTAINSFVEIENLQTYYNQIKDVLPKTFYFNGYHLISINRLLKTSKLSPFDLNLFTNHIKDLNFQLAYESLKTYFVQVNDSLGLDDYGLKRFCQNIVYSTLNTCDQLGFDVADINKSKIRLFKTIDLATSLDDLEDILFDILEQISNSISLQSEQKNSLLINQIKRYVDEHYSNDISLTDIANALHINYYYMSSYFKTHTNENLSTYINKVRVEKAKVLLMDSQIAISQISEMVGFSEHNYFSKVFKKHTKLTPTKYRRKVLGL